MGCNQNQSQFFDLAHGTALAAGGQLNQGWHVMGKKALWGMVAGLA